MSRPGNIAIWEGVIYACLELSAIKGIATIMNDGKSLDKLKKDLESSSKKEGIRSPENNLPTMTTESPDKEQNELDNSQTMPPNKITPIKIEREPLKERKEDPSLIKTSTKITPKEEPNLDNDPKMETSSKRKRETSPTIKRKIFFSNTTLKKETIEISSDEEETPNFWHTYEYPTSD